MVSYRLRCSLPEKLSKKWLACFQHIYIKFTYLIATVKQVPFAENKLSSEVFHSFDSITKELSSSSSITAIFHQLEVTKLDKKENV